MSLSVEVEGKGQSSQKVIAHIFIAIQFYLPFSSQFQDQDSTKLISEPFDLGKRTGK